MAMADQGTDVDVPVDGRPARAIVVERPGDGGGTGAAVTAEDMVTIRVGAGEVVITVRVGSAAARQPREASEPSIDGSRELPAATARAIARRSAPAGGERAGAEARMPAEAAPHAAVARVGFGRVPATRVADGFAGFQLRADLVDSYRSMQSTVQALGGKVTSSGGLRDLGERATAGRSKRSLHYTGRAIDLYIYSGMQGSDDQYLIARDGGTDANPEWCVYCVSHDPDSSDPAFDGSLLREGELECVRWKKGVGAVPFRVRTQYFSLTEVMARHGWAHIPARRDWATEYLSCEWWHFQNHTGLIPGVSTFGDQLMQVWPSAEVLASGLDLGAVWSGLSFHAADAVPGLIAPAPEEKVRWAQAVLRATAGEVIAADGELGPRTSAALRRFQERVGISITGALEATTEVALIQMALRRLTGAWTPRFGTLDEETVDMVRRFQRQNRLTVDGRVGPKSRARMLKLLQGEAPARTVAKTARTVTRKAAVTHSREPSNKPARRGRSRRDDGEAIAR